VTVRANRLWAASAVIMSTLVASCRGVDTGTGPSAPVASASVASSSRFVFSMPQSGTTSAGVYDSAGRLIRTLWSGEALAPGEYVRFWDKTDDAGRVASPGKYEVRLIIHRLSYVWEGVVGNSSGVFVGPQVHKALQPPASITISGEHAYYAVGYNEGQTGIHGFQLSTPQFDTHPIELVDPFVAMSMVSADATRIYWANTGGFSHSSFVAAFDLATGQASNFAAGARVCLNMRPDSTHCYEHQDYSSVIDVATDASAAPTGLAVQSRGRVLAVAHGGQDRIRLYDKLSGASIGEIGVPLTPKGLNQLAMSPGGDLWVISGHSLLRFTNLDTTPTLVATVTGLIRPLAVAVSPANDDIVWVADGGASQQLKRLDRNGVVQAIVGVAGGYGTDPVVADTKLCFQGPGGQEQTAVAVAADESIWVVDYCNDRMLRFRPGGRLDGEVAYLPKVYASTVDHGNPTRVFANYLEFEVDYTVPLTPGRSWKLVRNWLAGLPPALRDPEAGNSGFDGFRTVETLSNGRTFGLLSAGGRQVIVELPALGPARLVNALPPPGPNETPAVMYENGDVGYAVTSNGVQSVMRLPLSGFTPAGDPVWLREPRRLAAVPALRGTPYYRGTFSGVIGPRFPVTESGNVIFFDQSVTGNEGFHLGAAAIDGDTWLWQASPTGPLDGRGAFQTKSIDTTINYGGNVVWSSGRHVVYGFHGEFYTDLSNHNVGQANQFLHYYDDGLFIGQFGLPSTRTTIPSAAGLSGNAFSPTLVRVGDQLYLYHNDESAHGGVHRWRFDGWQDLKELRLPLQR
jgi:hypothetical protein